MRSFILAGAALLSAATASCAAPRSDPALVGDYLTGRFAAQRQSISEAAAAFDEVRAAAPNVQTVQRSAFFLSLAAGEYPAAMQAADRLAQTEDGDDTGGYARAALVAQAFARGEFERSGPMIDAAENSGFPASSARLLRAWRLVGAGSPDEAIELLLNAPRSEYGGFYPLHIALISEREGDLGTALRAHQASIRTLPGAVEIAAFGAFLERGEDRDAEAAFYNAIADEDGYGRIAARAWRLRQEDGARSRRFQNPTPRDGAAIAFLSIANGALQQQFDRREAAANAGFRLPDANYNLPLAMAQLALYLDPDFDHARRLVGTIFNAYEDHELAIGVLRQITEGSVYFEQSRIEIAAAQNSLERRAEAIETLRALLRERPRAFDARLTLASFLAARERHADAVRELDILIDALPEDPATPTWRYFLSRGASLIELDRWPEAERDLQRAVEIAPEEATALNYLGYSWAERGENLDEAFALIEKALALEPRSGAITDSLGWAHYQLGNYDEAVKHLEKAAMLEPSDPTITDHLGDVYWRLDRRLEARYQWRRVLELEADDDLQASVRAKIDGGLAQAEPSARVDPS